jgi:uncharacterized repeat protein (TIGR03803 family)
MSQKVFIALSLALLIGSAAAHAANPQPVAVATFACSGNKAQRVGPCPRGGEPSLIQGSDGNFYGTTFVSSEGNQSQPNGGTVFSVTPNGKFTLLHTFLPGVKSNYPNGNNPGPITEGSDGNFYGMTVNGGVPGHGVLYRVGRKSGFQLIHQFCSAKNCTDGYLPEMMVAGTDGNLYGLTRAGGTGNCFAGCGTIFRVVPATGTYEVVFNFDGQADGNLPGSLTLAPDGSIYGFSGSIFHYVPATGDFQLLPGTAFPRFNGDFGSFPISSMVIANGKLYGLYTIYLIGGSGLFEVNLDGSNLHLFPEYNTTSNGGSPGGMLVASDGNLWVAEQTANNFNGDLIALSLSTGTVLKTLNPFSTNAAVGAPPAALLQVKDGTLWGTTTMFGKVPAGHFGDGVVYNLNAGLPPR